MVQGSDFRFRLGYWCKAPTRHMLSIPAQAALLPVPSYHFETFHLVLPVNEGNHPVLDGRCRSGYRRTAGFPSSFAGPRFWHGGVMLRWVEFWLCWKASPFGNASQSDGPGPGPREVVLDPPCRAGEVPGPTPGHPFQSPELDLCRLVHDPRRIADRDPSLLHRPPPRRSGGTVFRQHPGGVNHCSPAHPQQRGRFPLSERTVQICAISLWRTSGSRPRRELVGFASMAALFSSGAR